MCVITQLTGVSAIGGFLFGYNTSIIAAAQLYFVDTWPDITTGEIALIVSLALIGCAFGAFFSGQLSGLIGRKQVILISDVIMTAGALIMAFSQQVWLLILARIIIGIGTGASSQIVPLYLAEVAPTEIRGKMIAVDMIMITFGQLVSILLGLALVPYWRVMVGIAAIPAVLQFIFALCLPQSPRWLVMKDRRPEAESVLAKIYYPESVAKRIEELENEADQGTAETHMTKREKLHSLFTTYLRCVIIGCGVHAGNKASGINTAMYYGPSIMIAANIKIGNFSGRRSGLIMSIPFFVTNFVAVMISFLVVDKFGRRYSMLRALPFMAASMVVVAIGMFTLPKPSTDGSLDQGNSASGYMAIIGLIVFLIFYGIGMGPIVWTVASEIFPLHIAGTANSLAITAAWLTNFVISEVFPFMLKDKLKGWAFIMLAGFCILTWLLVYFMLPETANKSIEDNLKAILGSGFKHAEIKSASNEATRPDEAEPKKVTVAQTDSKTEKAVSV